MASIYSVTGSVISWIEEKFQNEECLWDYCLEDLDEAVMNNDVLLIGDDDRIWQAPSYLIRVIYAFEEIGYKFDYRIEEEIDLLWKTFREYDNFGRVRLSIDVRITIDYIKKELIIYVDGDKFKSQPINDIKWFITEYINEDLLYDLGDEAIEEYKGGKR